MTSAPPLERVMEWNAAGDRVPGSSLDAAAMICAASDKFLTFSGFHICHVRERGRDNCIFSQIFFTVVKTM